MCMVRAVSVSLMGRREFKKACLGEEELENSSVEFGKEQTQVLADGKVWSREGGWLV